jgi:type IV pilus assembly protein PilV
MAPVRSAHSSPQRAGGALLLEALTAIAIFSVGVLGTVAISAQSMGHIDAARYRGEAARLALSQLAAMAAEDPALLAERYDSERGGAGHAAFARLAQRLPGASVAGNAPSVRVTSGPSLASRSVTVTLRWQMPGTAIAHRYAATGVIGRN